MIAGVDICTDADDVLLTTAQGQCIRFAVNDVRMFKGRDSTGVRGIKLEGGDHVISMALSPPCGCNGGRAPGFSQNGARGGGRGVQSPRLPTRKKWSTRA